MLPEANGAPKANRLPEVNGVAKANRMPEVDGLAEYLRAGSTEASEKHKVNWNP